MILSENFSQSSVLVPLNAQTADAPSTWQTGCHQAVRRTLSLWVYFLEDQSYKVRCSWKCHCLFERPNTGRPLPPTWQTGCHQAVIKTNSICLQNSFCWKDSPDFVRSRGQNDKKNPKRSLCNSCKIYLQYESNLHCLTIYHSLCYTLIWQPEYFVRMNLCYQSVIIH